MNVVYLHGFASSPDGSSKVKTLAERLNKRGIALRVPDLNVPDFEHLTLTAMIARAVEEIAACPPGAILLIGSSMGGSVAVHTLDYLKRGGHPDAARVAGMILLAPGLAFSDNRLKQLGDDGIRAWREGGWLTVHHYGYNEPRRVHYGIMEDAARYDSYALHIDPPIVIIHGTRDDVVALEDSARFAKDRPNVTLKPVDSDHGLTDQVDLITAEVEAFIRADEMRTQP